MLLLGAREVFMLVIFKALILIVLLNPLAHAQPEAQPIVKAEPVAQLVVHVKSISLFKNEIQLDIDRSKQVKVGTKFTAQTSVNHKCLLIVKKIIKDLAYADATQCPGYATLKKGQAVTVSADDEVNEEIRMAAPVKSEDT